MPAHAPTDAAPDRTAHARLRTPLAPMLLALVLGACGAGSPPLDGQGAPSGGTDSSGAGEAAAPDSEPAVGMAVGADTTPGTDAPAEGSPHDPDTDPAPEGETVDETVDEPGRGAGTDTGSDPDTDIDPDSDIGRIPGTSPDTDGGGEPVPTDTGSGADAASGSDPDPGQTPGTSPDTSPDTGTGGDAVSGPLGCDAPTAAVQTRALELINAARAEARVCGSAGSFTAAGPLGWDSRLEDAARTHSADMAASGNFDHTGTDGSDAGQRIERAGYVWGEWAENIAAGQRTLEEAVAGWIDSPGHCRNLMQTGVTDVAVACVSNEDARYRRYWTNLLARPFEGRHRR